jgi:hypothetical protein
MTTLEKVSRMRAIGTTSTGGRTKVRDVTSRAERPKPAKPRHAPAIKAAARQ